MRVHQRPQRTHRVGFFHLEQTHHVIVQTQKENSYELQEDIIYDLTQ